MVRLQRDTIHDLEVPGNSSTKTFSPLNVIEEDVLHSFMSIHYCPAAVLKFIFRCCEKVEEEKCIVNGKASHGPVHPGSY